MTPLDKIQAFLKTVTNVSLGYSDLVFISFDKLKDGQIGYSIDPKNNSLITGEAGSWQKEWLVIGNDSMGDPVFVDTGTEEMCVLTAAHGEDEWDPAPIADSLESFAEIVTDLKQLSIERDSPVALETNPIPDKEQKQFIKKVKNNNPDSEIYFWEIFLGME